MTIPKMPNYDIVQNSDGRLKISVKDRGSFTGNVGDTNFTGAVENILSNRNVYKHTDVKEDMVAFSAQEGKSAPPVLVTLPTILKDEISYEKALIAEYFLVGYLPKLQLAYQKNPKFGARISSIALNLENQTYSLKINSPHLSTAPTLIVGRIDPEYINDILGSLLQPPQPPSRKTIVTSLVSK
jgi:hypothetical protein